MIKFENVSMRYGPGLEALSKDNRVLSFKLKKSEKSVNELSSEKTELESRLKQGRTDSDRKWLDLD